MTAGSRTRRTIKRLGALTAISLLVLMGTSCSDHHPPQPTGGQFAGPDGKPVPFREPVRLSSKDGVLEVRLSAHQGTVKLDRVSKQVSGLMVLG